MSTNEEIIILDNTQLTLIIDDELFDDKILDGESYDDDLYDELFDKNNLLKECPICFDNLNIENECITNCHHIFCKQCLDNWFDKGKITCPNCRENIKYITNMKKKIRLITVKEKIIREVFLTEINTVSIHKIKYIILCIGNIFCLGNVILNIYLISGC
jgi:hypothetical protein|tara:strand:+ start:423 stop:899 length:477 start_codon:yes stop_codon:yes gene_type:complete